VSPVDALYDEGQSQLSAGRLREAARLFAAVLERQPTHSMARIRLVEVRQELENTITRTIAEAERAETQLQYADALPMWEHVLDLVEAGDPRATRARQGIDEARRRARR
jgi:cytochrome c-type biogenesis protein CcmH/NrfG